MSINLCKHKELLKAAWNDVLNEKTDTDWALFGYEGQTNDLKVVSKGNGGIEELIDDLNSGKIMYAFIKIDDPKTSLPKYVLLNWQGEGANTIRKGLCANHLRDVERFFTGAHCTINARTEEEVEPQLIIDKVAKVGSVYSFKQPRGDYSDPSPKPVGTNYQRVNPVKEINATERDQFWLREEEEEKKRVEEERKRKELERQKLDEEMKQRELAQAAQREAEMALRNSTIDQIKQAEKMAFEAQKKQLEAENYDDDVKVEKINNSDMLRQQRNREAQDLIAQRTIDARSIFEKNTSAGQIIKKTPEKPVRNSILKAQQQHQLQHQQHNSNVQVPIITTEEDERRQIEETNVIEDNVNEEQISDDDSDQFATIKRSPKDVIEKKVTSASTTQSTLPQEIVMDERIEQITEQQFVDEIIYGDIVDTNIKARALYDYQAADDTEITFDPGDIITHIALVDEGWWQGLAPDGTYGLFPANYVQLID